MSALRKNTASQVVTFSLVNATTGAALTGATVTVKATLDGTQSAGAGTVTELGTGQYKYVPTQGETNGTTLGLGFTATNAVPVNLHCFITATDPTDAVRMGLTALPNAAAEAAGGLYTRGTGAGQINQDANGRVDANAKAWAGTATTLSSGVPDVNVKTITAGIIAAASFASGALDAVWSTATRALTDKAGFALSSAGVQAIWDALSSALTTVGSIGKRLVDDLTGDIYARLGAPAGASVSADIAAAKSDTAAVKLQTDKLAFTVTNQVDANVLDWKSATAPAMTGDAYARLGAPAGASVSADVAAVKSDTAAVKLKTDNLPSDPADASDIAAAFATVNATLATIASYIDTEVASIKTVTDQLTAAQAEPTAAPAANATPLQKIAWLAALARNKVTQTASTQALRNDADGANIATAAVSDDGTTFTRGEWS
jgi:hypothetical protein